MIKCAISFENSLCYSNDFNINSMNSQADALTVSDSWYSYSFTDSTAYPVINWSVIYTIIYKYLF
jgi:hypothetical protein